MNLETILQGYRVKYGLEMEKASPGSTPTFDEFASVEEEPDGFDEYSEQNNIPTNFNASLSDDKALDEFITAANSNKYLQKSITDRQNMIGELSKYVNDPNTPYSLEDAKSFIMQMHETLKGE